MEPILILVLVGASGGLIRSLIGFMNQADEGEKFNWKKLVASVLRASIAGSLLVYQTVEVTESIEVGTYIGAFFTSMGADVFLKEIYGTVKGSV